MNLFGTAIILAGGKSKRMGFDKQLISFKHKKLINNQIDKLSNLFEDIIVVTHSPHYYRNMNCRTLCDEIYEKGPLAGIHVGLKHAISQFAYVLACDMPHINMAYIEYMQHMMRTSKRDACITHLGNGWIEPFNAFYSKSMIEKIEAYLLSGKRSIYTLIEQCQVCYIDEKQARRFSPHWEMFLNLNTREEVKKYRRQKEV